MVFSVVLAAHPSRLARARTSESENVLLAREEIWI
jgi:hypothetical protein